MTDKDKYVDLVVTLMRRTSEGEVQWKQKQDRHADAHGLRAEVYEAEFKGRTFVLQDARSYLSTKTNPGLAGVVEAAVGGGFYLEVSGPDDTVIEFPRLDVIDDLARLVRGERASDLEELERLLSSG